MSDMSQKEEREIRKAFRAMFTKHTWFTIERSNDRYKHYLLIFWTLVKEKPFKLHTMMFSGEELVDICDMILDELKKDVK